MIIKKAQTKRGRYSIELTEEGNLFSITERRNGFTCGGSYNIRVRQDALDRFYDLIDAYKTDGINLYVIGPT